MKMNYLKKVLPVENTGCNEFIAYIIFQLF